MERGGGRRDTRVERGMAAHEKGKRLEDDFAVWMKKRLGYRKVHLRERVRGRVAERPYEVDVHGIRGHAWMTAVEAVGYALVVVAVAMFAGELPEVRRVLRIAVAVVHPALAGFTLLLLGLGGILVGRYARRRRMLHAWVECKAHKTTVRREQVQKLLASIDDVRQHKGAAWTPDRILFVSSTGFDPDALNFARAYGITCYRREGKGFVRVKV